MNHIPSSVFTWAGRQSLFRFIHTSSKSSSPLTTTFKSPRPSPRSIIKPVPHRRAFSAMPPKKSQAQNGRTNGTAEAHQHQAGTTTDRKEDEWKHKDPYRIHDENEGFDVKWKGKCHCGKVQYQLSRDKPLASKYCHCTTCQRLHGVSKLRRHLGSRH